MNFGQMNTGQHLPAYVFLEQFVEDKRVLDMFPPDSHGTAFIRQSAKSVVSVVEQRDLSPFEDDSEADLVTAVAGHLPFSTGSFDVVFFFAQKEAARLQNIAKFLKSARGLVGQHGLVCLAIPNRDARGLEGKLEGDLPRYFDFERALRRQFPHVTMLAVRPLHGATLVSIGRGEADVAPLLDDRLLPEGSEAPSHFLGVCSARYRRVDESMIAQAPYEMFADPVRKRIDRLRSNMSIAMSESELRGREVEKLETQIEDMKEEVERAEVLKHEKASALALLKDTERQLETKDRVQSEFSRTNHELTLRVSEIEQNLFNAEQRARKEEKERFEAENKIALAYKEREDAQNERESVVSTLRTAKAETRARQREIDDVREELAGAEADLSALGAEVDRQRKETFSARERATKFELELKDFGQQQTKNVSFEAEIERVRNVAATDRERLERRLEEEHTRLLEEMEIRAKIEKRSIETHRKKEEATAKEAQITQEAAILNERLQSALARLETHEKGHRGAQKAKDEIEQLARDRGDRLDRYKHQMEIVSSRATQSEQRASELEKQIGELHTGLQSTEAELSGLKTFKKTAVEETKDYKDSLKKLTSDLSEAETENSKLCREVMTAQSELMNVKSTLVYERQQVRTESQKAGEAELRENEALDRIVELEDDFDKSTDHLARYEEEMAAVKADSKDLSGQVTQLEKALAEADEESKQAKVITQRLLDEKETELLNVSKDVEKELRLAAARYENSQGEIWELNEEIVRLRAQAAAEEATDDHSDRDKEKAFEESRKKQETIIKNLKRERDTLRKTYDKLHNAVKKKKLEKKLEKIKAAEVAKKKKDE